MAIGKRSLMNEHMIAVLNKILSTDPEPVQKSYLYYSSAEKDAVDYMISVDLLKEITFYDKEGNQKKGFVLGDFGRNVAKDIIALQMRMSIQEDIAEDPEKEKIAKQLQVMRTEYNSAVDSGSLELASQLRENIDAVERKLVDDYQKVAELQVRELDQRGSKKMETINKWKQQQRKEI